MMSLMACMVPSSSRWCLVSFQRVRLESAGSPEFSHISSAPPVPHTHTADQSHSPGLPRSLNTQNLDKTALVTRVQFKSSHQHQTVDLILSVILSSLFLFASVWR